MPMNEYGEIIRNSSPPPPIPNSPNNHNNPNGKSGIAIVIGIAILFIVLLSVAIASHHKNNRIESPVSQETNAISDSGSTKNDITDNDGTVEEEEYTENINEYIWDFSESLNEKNGYASKTYGDVEIIENNVGGYSASFDGDGDYIECGTDINLTENWSFHSAICCYNVDKNYASFFAKYETNFNGPYAFSVYEGHINCWFSENGGGHTEIESDYCIKNGEWVDVIVTKNSSKICLYINGVLESSDDIDCITNSDDLVTIGRQALMFEPYDQLQFTGLIEDISVYERVLTDEEIKKYSDKTLKKSSAATSQEAIYESDSPFEQKYWIIFTEAYRDDRVEASSINSILPASELYFVWDSSVDINDASGSEECEQFFFNDSDTWEYIGNYHRLTDGASHILASNLDVYDVNGELICKGCSYANLDWDMINSYR